MKNVLVSGGTGFLGRHLMRRLWQMPEIEKLWSISPSGGSIVSIAEVKREKVFKSVNITDGWYVANIMRRLQPDTVFHLAANPLVNGDPDSLVHTNIIGTHNLLKACPQDCRFVFASSATVYGDGTAFHSRETDLLKPNSVYGASKVACESLVSVYGRLGRINPVSLRLVANVGAGATHGIVLDFIRKLQSDSEYLEVLGDCPGSTKPFCHVSDTVEALILAAQDQKWTGEVNVGAPNELSVHDIAMCVMGATRISKEIKWLGEEANWKGDNKVVRVDSSKAKLLGWDPRYCLSRRAVQAGTLDLLEQAKSAVAA